MKFNITDTEREILDYLWRTGSWTSGAQFWEYFNKNGRPCKRQTVNTFLMRMVEKGLLVRDGRKYLYRYTRTEFEQNRAKEVLNEMYEGSFKHFLSALTGTEQITECEAEELKKYIDELS